MVETTSNAVMDLEQRYLAPTYKRAPFVLERGDGICLFDTEGKRYIDLCAGIATVALGHADREIAETIYEQARTLGHVSNLYHSIPPTELARDLCENSFADKVFFANSGAEANEAAIKFARRWASDQDANKTRIISFTNAFHGRTIGTLAATPREKYQAPFRPLMPNVQYAEFNNVQSTADLIGDDVCAVLVEPVQGEGGIHVATPEFLQGLRELCDKHNALLVFDEIQCGMGRTGKLWAYEHYGVTPDIMTLAKPLGGGLPMGACLMTDRVASAIHAGDHGSTFGANPIVAKAAQVVFHRINTPEFLARVADVGDYLMEGLRALGSPHILEVRGKGLIIGAQLDIAANTIVDAGYQHGLIMVNAGENVLRFVPPLILTRRDVDEVLLRLKEIFDGLDH
ncbi:MAG: aspartate aminotransferase family protein [Anaerolineae bacterium]|nr:aspartate aminotransferase family protein [Anaerolineae bacterium]